ncbi:MAG: DMT family transporter, partial [Candidatus Hodarchaeales archaeon]
MDPTFYLLGVTLAILAGFVINYGMVLQKKVVNAHKNDEEFLKNLAKNPTWLTGLVLQFVLGTIFMLTAQLFIGPALIPGLMASGLIILAVSSVKILGETLSRYEILGIAVMILATVLLGLSELSIPTEDINLLDPDLIMRT